MWEWPRKARPRFDNDLIGTVVLPATLDDVGWMSWSLPNRFIITSALPLTTSSECFGLMTWLISASL